MIDQLLFLGGIFLGLFGIIGMLIMSPTYERNGFLASVLSTVIAGVCIGLSMYTSYQLSKQQWIREDPYVTHQVVALQDGNEIRGNLRNRKYGMSGYINEEFMYVYGYKTASGGMKIQKVSEKQTVVYFNDEIAPNAKWYREKRRFWWSSEERYTCDIFIPTGSLQANITIDLQ